MALIFIEEINCVFHLCYPEFDGFRKSNICNDRVTSILYQYVLFFIFLTQSNKRLPLTTPKQIHA
jgi:hypothetical protein